MKTSIKLLALLVTLFAGQTLTQAQTWQPAVRLWGASMNNVVIQVPNGPPLIPLWNGPNAPNDSVWLYSIPTLSSSSSTYQVKNRMSSYSHVSDFNGNGFQDITGSPRGSSYDSLLLDAFGPTPRMRPIVLPNGEPPGYGSQLSQIFDLDGDSVKDVLTHRDADVRVVYGDRIEPFLQASTHTFRSGGIGGKYDEVIALGRISDKVCMVKLVWFEPMPGSDPKAKYVLEELDAEDLRTRRDTIRTHVLQEIIPEKGFAYQSPVIQCDSVWWIGAPGISNSKQLRVRIDGISEVEPHETWRTIIDGFWPADQIFHGQGREEGVSPLVCNGARPILAWMTNNRSDTQRVVDLWMYYIRIADQGDLRSRCEGIMQLYPGSKGWGGIRRTTLTPDIDGDQLEEVLVDYYAYDTLTSKKTTVVDLFITTGRVMSGVAAQIPTEQFPLASRRGDGWLVAATDVCSHLSSQIPIYTSDGRFVCLVVPRMMGAGLFIPHPNAIAEGWLYTVIGKCAVRLP